MAKQYKSKNGYYKFYNKEGKSCRIKCDYIKNEEAIIKFKRPFDSNWNYHYPSKKFKNQLETANYILKNLETDKTIFNIKSTKGLK